MLTQLYIENLAVIQKVSIEFGEGLNVFTGETGAGKSMIIDAVHYLSGERMSRDIIRKGADCVSVSAQYAGIPNDAKLLLTEFGIEEEEDDTLLLQRSLNKNGKNICKINGRPASVSMLKALSPLLLNIHGQHENYDLLSPNLHLKYLDSFSGTEEQLVQYTQLYKRLISLHTSIKKLQIGEQEKADRIDYLKYRIDELEKANVQINERDSLHKKKVIYQNNEKIRNAVLETIQTLEGDESSVLDMIEHTVGKISTIQDYSDELQSISERLVTCEYELKDILETIRNLDLDMDIEENEKQYIEERLDLLFRLSLKYGSSEEQMLETLSDMKEELNNIQTSEEKLIELMNEFESVKKDAISIARNISKKRKDTALRFENQVKKQLAFLDMPEASFSVQQERVSLNEFGCDRIQFLISSNKGEDLKPLSKVASGGELSRIMLAIKSVLSACDEVDTLIFDEIDTGISGSAAEKVGLKLKEVSTRKQVFCVTHLAQIAAMASSHYKISKFNDEQRTYTKVDLLNYDGRCSEIARIMGGAKISDLMLKNADEMIKKYESINGGIIQ